MRGLEANERAAERALRRRAGTEGGRSECVREPERRVEAYSPERPGPDPDRKRYSAEDRKRGGRYSGRPRRAPEDARTVNGVTLSCWRGDGHASAARSFRDSPFFSGDASVCLPWRASPSTGEASCSCVVVFSAAASVNET